MKELIKEIIVETKQLFSSGSALHSIQINPDLLKVQTIAGLGRAGKSSLVTFETEENSRLEDIAVHVIATWKWCAQCYDLYGL